MIDTGEYVYKKEVDWSLLTEGLTLPVENQVIFGRTMNRFLKKGEKKEINLYLNNKSFKAKIVNVNYSKKYVRKNDVLQIRYTKNGDLAQELQICFAKSYKYLKEIRLQRPIGSRAIIKLPEYEKEFLAIYTTEYDDSYVLETIKHEDYIELRDTLSGKQERLIELDYNYELKDKTSTFIETNRTVKIRRLNKKIGDNLKLLYGYRCQICGQLVGEKYDTSVVESHHIDYFVNSLNNDASNQMIVCPNHHSIIHDLDPMFDRKNRDMSLKCRKTNTYKYYK